jgi:hypothetical protein
VRAERHYARASEPVIAFQAVLDCRAVPTPPRIALVTYSQAPAGTDDDAPLRAAVAGATMEIWDDPAVAWDAYDLVVVRSTFDYIARDEEFRAWAHSVPRLVNRADVLAWNTDKRYLADVEAGGLPIIPTTFVAPGEAFVAPSDDGRAFVVKPSVSAGAKDTLRAHPGEEARAAALVAELHGRGLTVLVQPHVASVDERGETGLYFYAGRFSHAIGKGAVLERGAQAARGLELGMSQRVWPREPSSDELELGERAVAWLAERFGEVPAYARIDVVQGDEDGLPQVLELELTEPAMWFAHADADAPRRFAAVIEDLAAA